MRPLRAGSTITIVAPSGPYDRYELFGGLAWLSTRYRLRIDARILARDGFLAGTDDERAAVFEAALRSDSEAILCARGGYGAMRILDRLSLDLLRDKRLVGFSDITALHVAASARGIPTIHGPNVTGLGRSITALERTSILSALEDLPLRSWLNLEPLHRPGTAKGIAAGGNLALVEAMLASGTALPEGAILFLEDVGEAPYRVDRMLTALRLGGHLARASAIVFGSFTRCEPPSHGVTVEDVLRERTADLGIPVVTRAPFGHGAVNHAFWLGRPATLRVDRLEWET